MHLERAQLQLAGAHTSEHAWTIERALTIGREAADIQLPVVSVSRRHARVSPTPCGYEIVDLGSQNGTAVNGDLLNGQPRPLQHGDSILLAGQVELIFNDPNATPHVPQLGTVRGLWIDPTTDDVWIDAQRLSPGLSHKQHQLLTLIYSAKGALISRDDIGRHLWPNTQDEGVSNDAIDSLIKRLRRRLAAVDGDRPLVELVRGRGIRLITERDGRVS